METITLTTYTLRELADMHPDGYDRAIETIRRQTAEYGVPWADETAESVKAVIEAAGAELRDWSIDYDNPWNSWLRFDLPEGVEDMIGRRAWAWLENVLLSPLRVPWTGKARREVARYGYRPGTVKPCPFTGYCVDDDCLEAIRESIAGGASGREAIAGLAGTWAMACAAELEYALSEESILDLRGDDCEWLADGRAA